MFAPEAVIETRLRGLLVIYRKESGQQVVRCRLCHLGFSGERAGERAYRHVKGVHGSALNKVKEELVS
jgi:hypothetical protein